MKIRKYFRGSGRVLAFVFIASVIWLLFDMAALRISMTDVNSQLLKERVIKERELERKQATKVTHAVKGGFKHPVQRVEYEEKEQVQSLNKVAQAYRRQRKNQQQNEKHFQDHLHVASNNKVAPPGNVTLSPQLHVPRQTRAVVKKAVDLELSETLAESKKVVLDTFTKATVPVHLSNVIKGQRGVQEDKRLLLPTSANNSHAIGKTIENTLDNGDSKAKRQVTGDLNVKSVKQGSHIMASERHITKMPYNPHDIVKEKKADLKREKLDTNLFQSDSNTTRKAKDLRPQQGPESTVKPPVARKPGVHKVRALDATGAPRDAKAVGQFGHPAVVPSDKEGESKRRWVEGYFNVYLSDRIPLDRAIPDTRPRVCADGVVHDDLPTTSVIFCFVDEVWSTLLRSVHSVLNRSPPHLLKEIILVDDSSTKDYLKEQLDDYMSKFPKVRIVRLNERQGLIRARLAGAAIAQGEVLTFLDSHIECNVGWLEPLLERVFLDRKKVACPVIEVINDKDMSYVLVDNFQRGIFKWPLVFGWNTLSDEQIKKNNMTVSDPIRCPVMAGGLFSIDKKYFYELGAYDPGLDVWGGENMEISFKIWMCGGEIEIIPCSRVGHIFRGQNPYKFPKDRQKTVERNLARVAEVWLDEYKELFYGHGYHHLLDKNAVDIGNLTEQIALREKLQCQSFKWYLENVYSDLEAPLVKAEGLIFNRGLRKCLAVHDGLSFEICDLSKKSQQFNYTWIRHIRQQDLCISPQGKQPTLALELCHNSKRNLRWFHKTSNSALGEHLLAESLPHHMCLEAGLHSRALQLNECEPNNDLQKWQFTHYYVK